MTNKISTVLPTGILAGVVATLLVMGAGTQSTFASVLFAASALPILIAGLGWGNLAAITGIVTAAILGAALTQSFYFAITMAVATLIPAGWLSHLANLARPAAELGGPDHLVAWYPISDILLHLCGLVTIAIIVFGIAIGYGPELVGQVVDALFSALQAQEPALAIDAAMIAQWKRALLFGMPMVQGGIWVILLFAAFYFAVRIVSRSGRALRPREDMPSALRMNRHAIFVFLAGIVLTFVGGVPALIGATICGTFGAGFVMAGYAALHFHSKGKDWRLPALILAYLSAVMVLPLFAVLVLGLVDTRRTIALTPAKGDTKNGSDQNTTNSET
ncbi:DUF2232 domain-containing protein [Neorhizobium sp. NCHU2750]|uniref:DUF2232 domain-containing protein n=1 Tax=Neorhizobium sp. NCHU2750 TaxID=1825976 RepID=UPI000E768B14|nr:membrane protein [Neorhizobium sp. NCHU2750]